jgi:hypothetical protein
MDFFTACLIALSVILIAYIGLRRHVCPPVECKKQCPCPSGGGFPAQNLIYLALSGSIDNAGLIVKRFNAWWWNALSQGGMPSAAIKADPAYVASTKFILDEGSYSLSTPPNEQTVAYLALIVQDLLALSHIVGGGAISAGAKKVLAGNAELAEDFTSFGMMFPAAAQELVNLQTPLSVYLSSS